MYLVKSLQLLDSSTIDRVENSTEPARRTESPGAAHALGQFLHDRDVGCVNLQCTISSVKAARDYMGNVGVKNEKKRNKGNKRGKTNPLKNQLRNPIPVLDGKVLITEIKQQHLERTAVVLVYDARADIDRVFGREP